LDIATAERYMPLDVADSMSTFVDRGWRDPIPWMKDALHPLEQAVKAATEKGLQVAVGGECTPTLWAQGKAGAAIQRERLLRNPPKRTPLMFGAGMYLDG
jgi:hypothetical protein